MAHRWQFEAVDRTLRELRGDARPFGGVTCVIMGDTRQVLPVVRKGNRAQVVRACIVNSRLYDRFKVLELTENLSLIHI